MLFMTFSYNNNNNNKVAVLAEVTVVNVRYRFFPRDAMQARPIVIILSCGVCPSVTFVNSVLSRRINIIFKFSLPSDSNAIVVFFRPKRPADIPMRTTQREASMLVG